jgi:hypothetical protein
MKFRMCGVVFAVSAFVGCSASAFTQHQSSAAIFHVAPAANHSNIADGGAPPPPWPGCPGGPDCAVPVAPQVADGGAPPPPWPGCPGGPDCAVPDATQVAVSAASPSRRPGIDVDGFIREQGASPLA